MTAYKKDGDRIISAEHEGTVYSVGMALCHKIKGFGQQAIDVI
jgi:hypothetical protein